MAKKKKKNSSVSKIISIILIVCSIVVLIDIFKNVYGMFSLKKQSEEVEKQLQAIKDENASLIDKKEKLEDPDYAITYARGEYLFSMSDEKVFYLPGE